MEFDDIDQTEREDIIGQHNFTLSADAKRKIPYWFLTKIEATLREEIVWLKAELAKRDELITKLSGPTEVIKEIPTEHKTYEAAGKVRMTPAMLSRMEEIEKRKRWTKIIEEAESKAKSEPNVLSVDN